VVFLPKELLSSIKDLQELGFTIHGEGKVLTKLFGSEFLKSKHVKSHDSKDELFALMEKKKVDIVFNYPEPEEDSYNYLLRRKAVDFNIPLMNNLRVSQMIVEALKRCKSVDCESYEDYYSPAKDGRTKPTVLKYAS